MDSDDLGMSCFAGANAFVVGVWGGAAGIAGDDIVNAVNTEEDGFGAPEATSAKRGGVKGGGHGF